MALCQCLIPSCCKSRTTASRGAAARGANHRSASCLSRTGQNASPFLLSSCVLGYIRFASATGTRNGTRQGTRNGTQSALSCSVSSSIRPKPETMHLPEASSRVVESAVDLARAEARLALLHTRHLARHAVSALLLVIVAAAMLQVTVLTVALVPLLSQWLSDLALGFLVVVPALFTLALSWFAALTWKSGMRSASDAEPGGWS